MAYSEGSEEYDSDEWAEYDYGTIAKKLIDPRPTESIPVSRKLDYLEV